VTESDWDGFATRLQHGMGRAGHTVRQDVPDGHLPHLQMGTARLITQKRRRRVDELHQRAESRAQRKRYLAMTRERATKDAKDFSILKRDRLLEELQQYKFKQLRYGEARWAVSNHQDMATIWNALDKGALDPKALGADLTKQDVNAILDSIKEHDYSHVIFTKACNAMRTAAFNNLSNQNLLAQEGAIPMIVAGMHKHWDKEHAQATACMALASTACNHPSNQVLQQSAQAMPAITNAMNNHAGNEWVRGNAMQAGSYLTADVAARKAGARAMQDTVSQIPASNKPTSHMPIDFQPLDWALEAKHHQEEAHGRASSCTLPATHLRGQVGMEKLFAKSTTRCPFDSLAKFRQDSLATRADMSKLKEQRMNPNLYDHLLAGNTQTYLRQTLYLRPGCRPATNCELPMVQMTNQSSDAVFAYFLDSINKSKHLAKYSEHAKSRVDTLDTTFPALHLRDNVIVPRGKTTCMAMSREFAFVHHKYIERVALHRKIQGGGQGSFCVALPVSDAKHILVARWGEWHVLAGSDGNPTALVLVYAPRDIREVDICVGILEASCDFARQCFAQQPPLGVPGVLKETDPEDVVRSRSSSAPPTTSGQRHPESKGGDSRDKDKIVFYNRPEGMPEDDTGRVSPPPSPDMTTDTPPYLFNPDSTTPPPRATSGYHNTTSDLNYGGTFSTLGTAMSSPGSPGTPALVSMPPSPEPLTRVLEHSPGFPPLRAERSAPGSPIPGYNDGVLMQRSLRTPKSPLLPKSPFTHSPPKSPFLTPPKSGGMLGPNNTIGSYVPTTPMLMDIPATPLEPIAEDDDA